MRSRTGEHHTGLHTRDADDQSVTDQPIGHGEQHRLQQHTAEPGPNKKQEPLHQIAKPTHQFDHEQHHTIDDSGALRGEIRREPARELRMRGPGGEDGRCIFFVASVC